MVRAAIATWRESMRHDLEAWFAAEAAVARAVVAAGRQLRAQASGASGQYFGTLAMPALFVRDHLAPEAFALLYRPFAMLAALAALARE